MAEKYILLAGKHDGFDSDGSRKAFNEGDVIELNAEQAKAFADKVISYAEYEARNAVLKAQAEAAAKVEAELKAAKTPKEPPKETPKAPETPKAS